MKRFYKMLVFVFTDACFTDSKRFAKLTSENAKVSIDNTEIQIVVTFFDNNSEKTFLRKGNLGNWVSSEAYTCPKTINGSVLKNPEISGALYTLRIQH